MKTGNRISSVGATVPIRLRSRRDLDANAKLLARRHQKPQSPLFAMAPGARLRPGLNRNSRSNSLGLRKSSNLPTFRRYRKVFVGSFDPVLIEELPTGPRIHILGVEPSRQDDEDGDANSEVAPRPEAYWGTVAATEHVIPFGVSRMV